MGTRNLTVIIKDNKIRLSQYGQWDGYFDYTGVKFLEFVKEHIQSATGERYSVNLQKFKDKTNLLADIDDETLNAYREIYRNYGINGGERSNNTGKFAIPLHIFFPTLSRDTGVNILNIIQQLEPYEFTDYTRPKKTVKTTRFHKWHFPIMIDTDCSVIEFAYIIDLDNERIYMLTNHEFDGEPLETTELVKNTYKSLNCWYNCKIQDIPTVKEVDMYRKSIHLDYTEVKVDK